MKTRVKSQDGIELSTICRQLKLEASDGKKYETDCANTEDIFRIIQSIPSPKAEPFNRWLKWIMKGLKKLKIRNWRPSKPECFQVNQNALQAQGLS
jgi:hypothetical protein